MSRETVNQRNVQLVRVLDEVLDGYPLLNLKESHLEITSPYTFSALTYLRPIGNSRTARAAIELLSPDGDIVNQTIEFEFEYSEEQRIENAKQPSSFRLRPEAIYSKDIKNLKVDDFVNIYEDVVISKLVKSSAANIKSVELVCYFDKSTKVTKNDQFLVIVPVNFEDEEATRQISLSGTYNVNVLNLGSEDVIDGLALTVDQLKHYSIDTKFLNGTPPISVSPAIVVPKPYIEIRKIDYIPPKNIDSRSAQLIVSYMFNGRTFVERVEFQFAGTIREAAERTIIHESRLNFKYTPIIRKTPPASFDVSQFIYTGDLTLEITNVKYDYSKIDPDNRFVDVELEIFYRATIVKIKKRLEFQYSKNEYINGNWIKATTENGSISFPQGFINADYLYGNLDVETYDFKLQKELVKNAKIVEAYNYKEIRDIKWINFDPKSREQMFKVTVVEPVGDLLVERSFEKSINLQWSFEEWQLGKITADDLIIDFSKLQNRPTRDISERIFYKSQLFKVISIQYAMPAETVKLVRMQVLVGAGERTKYLIKEVPFQYSIKEYEQVLLDREIMDVLMNIHPKTISLNINTNNVAPAEIRPEQVLGVPDGIDIRVKYHPPKSGESSTRITIFLSRGTFSIGFEQTLIFARKS